MAPTIQKDVLILGGGIAGLWLLNRLHDAGFDVALLEHRQLGGGQTVASQGMIHGGVKYALSGMLTSASDAIADMPAHWKACLEGRGDVDLCGTRVLSHNYYMWPRHSFRSRFNAFFGSKALRGRVQALDKAHYPEFCRDHITGPLYQLTDLVLDMPSLLDTLCQRHRERIHAVDWRQAELVRGADGGIACLRAADGQDAVDIHARRYIITAGAGTRDLLEGFGLAAPPMQHRPLHMVMVKHDIQADIYVHCVSDQLSATPEVTITTHQCRDGGRVWYLGGELAESGVDLPGGEQVARAATKLRELFPWYDFSHARWASFHIDRAEPRQPLGKRPDKAFVETRHNFLVGWPTKLSLAPNLANEVMREFEHQAFMPQSAPAATLDFLPFPGIASPPWETAFS